jgi:hypothetical protein
MRCRNKDVSYSCELDDNTSVSEKTMQKSLLSEYPTFMITEPLFQLWFLSDVLFYQPAYEDIIKRAKRYYSNKKLKGGFYD